MRAILVVITLLMAQTSFGQAFYGKYDTKLQLGANLQNKAAGITGSLDFGLGDNISLGLASSYLIDVSKTRNAEGEKVAIAKFKDRFDLKARFSAHLSDVIQIDEAFDVYPGIYSSLKHFGGHLGVRYFFTHGLGVFTELNIPFAKYNTGDLTPAKRLNNQVSLSFGASFNI